MTQHATATALTQDLRDGRLSAVDLMAQTYAQIEAWNPATNAIVSLLPHDQAMAQAQVADGQAATGPLHGLPMAIKDLAHAKGFVTSMGAPLCANQDPAPVDEIMVARLHKAGALIIGKTNTPEFGLGSHTTNPVFGPTRNPWDLTRTPGGSSGGAAVALATGMLALADGSDMMGSLRNPAGWTGTYGLRPSWGAVPSEPAQDSFLHQLSTLGPMARNPQDLALLLSVQAGPDPRQPHGMTLPPPGPARPLRIGWLGDWQGAYAMEPGVLSTCEAALQVLEGVGHMVTPMGADFAADALWSSWTTLRSWQVAAGLAPLVKRKADRDALKPAAEWELQRGLSTSAMEIHDASVIRSQWFAQARALFDKVDVLALPSAQCWPFDHALDWPKEIAGRKMDTYHRWMEVVVPASLIGLPAIAVPAGLSAQGLPMGLQLIGPRLSDYALIALAQGFHEAAPWAGTLPQQPNERL
ncbi:MAG: amidase [Pseudomonadota bacterium]